MDGVYLVDGVRTPFGARGGALEALHPQELATVPLEELHARLGFEPARVDDVILGCVSPTDEQGGNIARIAPLVAGWGDDVPGVQLNRMCGSGQQAINFAASTVAAEQADLVIAGGVEHMTRVPMGSDTPDPDELMGDSIVVDRYFDHVDEMTTQGEGAERIAEEYGFTRTDVDRIAVESQQRWGAADAAGYFDEQLAPIDRTIDGESITLRRDEHPRPETTEEVLAELPLVFREEGNGVHHAGNSSGIVDGSSAVAIAGEAMVEEHGWEPLAEIKAHEVVGVDPVTMLTGPIPATKQLLERTDLGIDDIDRFEVNEAFASVVLAWLEETGADWDRTNVNGGAIAHGHPLGATGSALLTKLAYELERIDGRYGICTMCIGFGQGIATLIERV